MAAARIRETLECSGLSQENLSQSGVMSANTLANVANLLDLKDTESTRFVMLASVCGLELYNYVRISCPVFQQCDLNWVC